jgi:hypothetical protein
LLQASFPGGFFISYQQSWILNTSSKKCFFQKQEASMPLKGKKEVFNKSGKK